MPKSILRRLTKKLVVLANILVALLFLVGCFSELFVATSWWPVGFLTISLFYLLILLFLFCLFWLFFRSKWALLFVVIVGVTVTHIRNIIPFRLSQLFVMQKQPAHLRVMSWNVAQFDIMKHKEKPGTYNEMINLVNEFKPDIACFQEMVSGDTLADLNNAYYRKYSFYSIFEFAYQLQLPNYYYTYNYKDNFLDQQHFGIIIFTKYPIIKKQTISNYPYNYNSNFQFVDVVAGADTIRIFNCHLQSLRFSASNIKYLQKPSIKSDTDLEKSKSVIDKFKTAFLRRQLQADRVKASVKQSPYPVIVCGDFNDVPNSYPYETIGNDLQDAFVQKGWGLGRTYSGFSPTLRIDNIFIDKRYQVHQFIRVPKKLSDHFPIITDISRIRD